MNSLLNWEINWIRNNIQYYKNDKHIKEVIYCITQRYEGNLNRIKFYGS
jgi:hypothetical protein